LYTYYDPSENVILFGSNDALALDFVHERAAKLDAIHAFPFPFREIGARLTAGVGELAEAVATAPLLTDDHAPEGYYDSLPSFDSPFSRVAPELPCPCGSGLRFAECHGAATHPSE